MESAPLSIPFFTVISTATVIIGVLSGKNPGDSKIIKEN